MYIIAVFEIRLSIASSCFLTFLALVPNTGFDGCSQKYLQWCLSCFVAFGYAPDPGVEYSNAYLITTDNWSQLQLK